MQWKKIKSLDGTSGVYTGTVLSVVALSLVILFRERGFFQGREDTNFFSDPLDISPVWNRVLGSLFLLLFAILSGLLAFFLLVPNLCTFHRGHRYKKYRWELYSFAALIFADLLAFFLIASARNSFEYRRDKGDFESPVAHYFILVVFGIVFVQLNLLFLRIIIYNEAKDDTSPWVMLKERLDEAVLLIKEEETQMAQRKRRVSCFDFIAEKVAKGLYSLAKVGRGGKQKATGVVQGTIKRADAGISAGIVAWAGCMSWIGPSWDGFSKNVRGSQRGSFMWMLTPMVKAGDKIAQGVRKFRPEMEDFVRRSWEAIKEDEGYKHPAWIKGAVLTAAVLTVYFGLVINALLLGAINDIYFPLRTCILEYPLLTNFFLRLINFREGTNVASSPFLDGSLSAPDGSPNATALQEAVNKYANDLLDRLNGALEEDRLYNCSSGERGDASVLLAAINFVEADLERQEKAANVDIPEDVFFDETPGGVTIVFDSLMDNFRWSVWFGYACGLMVSLYTLLSVLRQYKKISLAIRSGLFTDLQLPQDMVIVDRGVARRHLKRVEAVVRTNLKNRSWESVIKRYPISNASFFFGILVSTAVLQLLVFGWILATIFALLASLPELIDILRPVFPVVVALLVMWFLNEVIANKFVAEHMLVQNYNVLHELYFVLFLLIYTGVYTVLGILYAVWRMRR
ncbi:unnamed protein product [Ostreobium quekettii]|uniref:Uncharacterized protein n=1 Tax=Ostreobium quekettii TaxID=121088 RepID=A0A8S1IXN8_9CHLO|nr:unnamed protein product [Ostreobium quekettii]